MLRCFRKCLIKFLRSTPTLARGGENNWKIRAFGGCCCCRTFLILYKEGPISTAMRVHLVNPSDTSFGTAVITPRWLYVLAAATPSSFGDPVLCDEILLHWDSASVHRGEVVGSEFTPVTHCAATRSVVSRGSAGLGWYSVASIPLCIPTRHSNMAERMPW